MNTPFLFITFGLIIRLAYAAFSHDFWLDEAFNYFIAQNNIGGILYALSYDNWPPLYTLLMGFWQKIASSAFLIRLPSVIFGTLTLPTIWAIGKILFNRKVANISLLLASFSPPLVYFSSENRPFALFGLLATLTILIYLKLSKKPSLSNLFFFTATGIASLYTHYFGTLAILALIVGGFFSKRWRVKFSYLLASILMMAVFFSPWLIYIFFRDKPVCLCLEPFLGLGATLAFMFLGGGGFITLKRFFEPTTPLFLRLFLTVFLAFSTFIFLWSIKFTKEPKIKFLTICFFLPVLFVFLASFFKPLFSVRSFIFLVPTFLILIAYSLDKIAKQIRFKWLFIIYIVSSAFVVFLTTQRLFFNQEPLWQTSTLLASFPHQNTQIVHANLYTYLPSLYYNPDLNQTVLPPNLPPRLTDALHVNTLRTFRTFDTFRTFVFVYAVNRTDNRQLQTYLIDLYNTYGNPQEINLNNIRILIFKPKHV